MVSRSCSAPRAASRSLGEASDGDEVVDAVATLHPDVVLMDLRMARVGGIAATRDDPGPLPGCARRSSSSPRSTPTMTCSRRWRAGAAGFLLKDTPPSDIVHAIETVAGGEPLLSPSVTRRLMDLAGAFQDTGARDVARGRLSSLTERERDRGSCGGPGVCPMRRSPASPTSARPP